MVLLPTDRLDGLVSPRRVWADGPIVVGAGPSGLAVAACLRQQGVVLERADRVASLWHRRASDRPTLHLPRHFCDLPHMPFPDHYPEYPTRQQFVDYLDGYAATFQINPVFSTTALSACYNGSFGLWRVRARGEDAGETAYVGRWLVAATGDSARSVVPDIPGLEGFAGEVVHVGEYRSGEA